MEKVDILLPPSFKKSGTIKPRQKAWENSDWIGTFNLWIVQSKPVPSIVYQKRSSDASWAPGKLDVAAGGHYWAGEELYDGLREVREELGVDYQKEEIIYLGRKLHVDIDESGNMRNNVVDITLIKDDISIDEFDLNENEVYAVTSLPIEDLIKVHKNKDYSFSSQAIKATGEFIDIDVDKESFPYSWDNYHFKMALLANRFLKGEDDLVY